jgi:type I restriction enzyme S subunit
MNSVSKLKNVAILSTDKIDAKKVAQVNFISVDNLNPNKQGVSKATFQPKGSLVHFKKGDILVGNIRPYLRKIWLADKDGGCSPDVLVFKAGAKTDNSFLYYSLFRDEFFEHMMTGSKGTKMPRGDKNQILEFEIPKFELEDQQKIASVLSALDSKIELNNRINAELEAMAKTLYDYWFVQFDFPISAAQADSMSKPNLEGKPYKSSGGKMVWNKELKREIPEGWEALTLDNLANIIGGSTPSRDVESYFTQKGFPWITPKDLSLNVGKKFIRKGELDVTEEGKNAASLNVLPQGSVLMSSRAPVGYLAIARNEVTTNQGFKSFVPKSYYTTEYLFYTIKNLLPVIENNASGSTFKEVSGSVLKTIHGLSPKQKIVEQFTVETKAIFNRQELLEEENQQLASLRDWLLPMLMNGQVRVGGAYAQTEDATEHLMAAEPTVAYGRKE